MWAIKACGGLMALAGLALAADPLPDGPGKKTLESACTTCHSLEIVTGKKYSRAQWLDVVDRMKVPLGAEEKSDLVGYLSRHFGDKDRSKELVEEICSFCHGLARLQGHEYTREQWENVIKGMIFEGAPVTDDEFSLILNYLEKNFGPANKPGKKEEK